MHQLRGSCDVRVGVHSHIQPVPSGLPDQFQFSLAGDPPVALPDAFHMAQVKRHIQGLRDMDHLCHRMVGSVTLCPDMNSDRRPCSPDRFQHPYKACLIVGIFRRVSKPQADAERPLFQGLHDLPADAFLFGLRQCAFTIPGYTRTDCSAAHQHSRMDTAAHAGQSRQILLHGSGRVFRLLPGFCCLHGWFCPYDTVKKMFGFQLVASSLRGCRQAAVSVDHGRDPLPVEQFIIGPLQRLPVPVPVNVDESGRYITASCIQDNNIL